jgi:hypothetical protein
VETLVYREMLADVYLRENGTCIVRDYSPRVSPMFLVSVALWVIALLAYVPLIVLVNRNIAMLVLFSVSALTIPIVRRVNRIIRGTQRGHREFGRA